jgi:hypothetical protein
LPRHLRGPLTSLNVRRSRMEPRCPHPGAQADWCTGECQGA